ncbi:MAG: hypothetical protein ACRD2L_02720 [Terriglobia bacterium]
MEQPAYVRLLKFACIGWAIGIFICLFFVTASACCADPDAPAWLVTFFALWFGGNAVYGTYRLHHFWQIYREERLRG